MEQIASLVEAERWAEALEAALALWRRHRDPGLATLVRQLDARARGGGEGGEGRKGPQGRTSVAFDASWHELAAQEDGVTTGWLASTVLVRLPRQAWDDPGPSSLARRLAVLEARTPDPRLADAALEVLGHRMHFHERVLTLLRQAGDPSVADRVWEYANRPRADTSGMRQLLKGRLPGVARALERMEVEPLAPEDQAAVARLVEPGASEAGHARSAAELLEHVLAHPADDEAREVLVDAWLAEGSPRGTYASQQREGVPEGDKAMKRLRRKHQEDWIGPALHRALKNHGFRLGLLHEAELQPGSKVAAGLWSGAVADPRLATLRTLRRGRGTNQRYLEFLGSSEARDLRRVEIVAWSMVEALASTYRRPLEALELFEPPSREVLGALMRAPAFEGVHTLGMTRPLDVGAFCADAAATGWQDRLQHLEIRHGYTTAEPGEAPWTRLDGLAGQLPALRSVTSISRAGLSLRFQRAGSKEGGWSLTIHVPDGAEGSRLTVDDERDDIELDVHDHEDRVMPPTLLELPSGVVEAHLTRDLPELAQRLSDRWSIAVTTP